jgi:hypothetical protein
MSLRHWVNEPDRGYGSLGRATRTAIVMPAMFAIGDKVIGNPIMATFAAFGSSALLLLVDFSGSMRDRLRAQAALAGVGAVLVCLGTLAGRAVWPSTVAMALVAFGVLFSGVVGLVLAGATTSLLPAFILAITFAGPVSSIPARLAGWAMASAATLVVIAVLGQPPPVTRCGPVRWSSAGRLPNGCGPMWPISSEAPRVLPRVITGLLAADWSASDHRRGHHWWITQPAPPPQWRSPPLNP